MPRGKKRLNKKKKNQRNGATVGMAGTRSFIRAIDQVIPKTTCVMLQNVTRIALNNATATYANKQLLVTTIGANFDPNSSTTITSLGLLKQMYDRYRVVRARVTAEFWNADNVVVEAFIGYANNSISNNNSNIATYITNPGFKRKLLPTNVVAGSRTRLSLPWIQVRNYLGAQMALYDDNFTAATNGSGTPSACANNIYCVYGEVTLNSVLTNGVYFDITTWQEVEFFERTVQLT